MKLKFILFYCLEKFLEKRKDKTLRCGEENSFMVKDIYEEIFKRSKQFI